ncbi:MAG TPA: outer membrane beta-barrel protein [Terriglobia bacterium]|nr:outer membrane beta-barrel protein [Terriglobia bacterium]
MKFFRNGLLVTAIMALTFAGTPSMRAEDGKSEAPPAATSVATPSASPAATPAEVSSRMQELQDEMDRIQGEMANLKKQLGVRTTSASPGASTPQAVQTESAPASPATIPTPPAPAASTEPAGTSMASILGPMSVTGFVDGYYGYNFEHPHLNAPSVLPGNPGTGLSGLRAFDSPYDQLSLNAVEVIMDKPPDAKDSRIGYHVALGFGNAMNVVGSTEPGGLGYAQYLKEAYGSYLVPVGKGLQVDFGKFVTQHGAEVIESKDNWNYSRSLLFTYAIPFYHFGLRAKYVFNDKYNFTAYLVNGWNNIVDNNTGKTAGFQFGWNPNKKVSFTQNYMVGPEEANNNKNIRQLWDTELTYSPTGKLSFMGNFDYGRGDRIPTWVNPVWWSGVAAYVRYQFNPNYALSTRYEYYDDPSGFTTGITAFTPQHIHEVTETFERKIHNNFITRLEYRRDMASQNTLFKGTTPVDHQDTVAVGLIYTFDLKEVK